MEIKSPTQLAPTKEPLCSLGLAPRSAPFFPSDNKETFVEVFSQEGDPAFVYGLYGRTNGDMIEQIEKDLNENRDYMEMGDGRYLYRVAYESAQIGDEGRIELPAYWDLTLIAFYPNTAIRHGADVAPQSRES